MRTAALLWAIGLLGACYGTIGPEGEGEEAPAQQRQATAYTATLLNWQEWFPFSRNQDYGQRYTTSWQKAPWQNSKLGGQSTWRYPRSGEVVNGVAANRPNPTMPATHSRPGYTSSHVVNYFLNWVCSPAELFNPSQHNCLITPDHGNYSEVQSETPDGRYLETWGYGGSSDFKAMFKDEVCLGGDWSTSAALRPENRDALLWALPATTGIANLWVGPSVCQIHFDNYATAKRNGRTYVAIYTRSRYLDPWGFPIVEAVNGYYEELGTEPCMTALPSYASDAAGQSLRLIREQDAEHPYRACLTIVEHYYMRKVDRSTSSGVRRNGFGSWELAHATGQHPPNWNRAWNPASQGEFVLDTCDFVGGRPANCR